MYKLNENAWFEENEEYIKSLPPQSVRIVTAVCPLCKKRRKVQFAAPSRKGRTFCNRCAHDYKSFWLIGTRVNNITILDYAGHKSNYAYFRCLCHCGKEFFSRVNELRDGSRKSCGCLSEKSRYKGGTEHPLYNFSMPDEERISKEAKRKLGINNTWRKAVKTIFGNTCFVCGSDENLVAHHIEGYRRNRESRFSIYNGICLCETCHKDYHFNFMGGIRIPATKESFVAFMEQKICQRLQL